MKALPMVLTLVILASACGGSDSTGPASNPVGTYRLEAIDGQPLPYDLFSSEIQSGSLTLRADGTYSATTTSRDEDIFTGEVTTNTETETGTYSHNGGAIRFTSPEGSLNATYDGTAIEINAVFIVLKYRRGA